MHRYINSLIQSIYPSSFKWDLVLKALAKKPPFPTDDDRYRNDGQITKTLGKLKFHGELEFTIRKEVKKVSVNPVKRL